MALVARNTGTHFRYDDDDQQWKAKVHLKYTGSNEIDFDLFLGEFNTLAELIAWLQNIFTTAANRPDTTVQGM